MIKIGLYTAIKAKIYDESLRGFLPGGSFCFYRLFIRFDKAVKSLVDKSAKDKKKEIALRRKKLEANKTRISELDGIFKRIYEDNISGKLSDERFAKLSADYEREQKQLISDTEMFENELNQEAEQVDNVEYFLNIVRQYTEIKELSARVVNDLIDKIKVHAVDKSSGQRVQKIDIYYTAVGLIDVSQHIQELV